MNMAVSKSPYDWVSSEREFGDNLERWAKIAETPPLASWQLWYDEFTKEGKIEINKCFHPKTNQRLLKKTATELIKDLFLNYGASGWRKAPKYEIKYDIEHKSDAFWRVIYRTEKPELDNIYIKLRIAKNFSCSRDGITADKMEIISFHPERYL